MTIAVLSVGSNIDPHKNIARAKEELERRIILEASSPFIETAPLGYTDQPSFINGAWRISTDKSMNDIQNMCKEIESICERVRTENKNGPRTIDLDIVVWDYTVVDPDYCERDFLRHSVHALIDKNRLILPDSLKRNL